MPSQKKNSKLVLESDFYWFIKLKPSGGEGNNNKIVTTKMQPATVLLPLKYLK